MKPYGKTERELQSYSSYCWVTSKDIGMVLEMDKSSTVGTKKGKNMEYTEMPDEQRMKNIEESGYRYLCIIQDTLHKK